MNGSLIQESTATTNATLADTIQNLQQLYKTDFSRMRIGQAVRQIEDSLQNELGIHAEFWMWLGIGAIIAYPKSYSEKIRHYRAQADKCPDQDDQWLHHFYTNLQKEIDRRYEADDNGIERNTRLLYLSVHLRAKRMLDNPE